MSEGKYGLKINVDVFKDMFMTSLHEQLLAFNISLEKQKWDNICNDIFESNLRSKANDFFSLFETQGKRYCNLIDGLFHLSSDIDVNNEILIYFKPNSISENEAYTDLLNEVNNFPNFMRMNAQEQCVALMNCKILKNEVVYQCRPFENYLNTTTELKEAVHPDYNLKKIHNGLSYLEKNIIEALNGNMQNFSEKFVNALYKEDFFKKFESDKHKILDVTIKIFSEMFRGVSGYTYDKDFHNQLIQKYFEEKRQYSVSSILQMLQPYNKRIVENKYFQDVYQEKFLSDFLSLTVNEFNEKMYGNKILKNIRDEDDYTEEDIFETKGKIAVAYLVYVGKEESDVALNYLDNALINNNFEIDEKHFSKFFDYMFPQDFYIEHWLKKVKDKGIKFNDFLEIKTEVGEDFNIKFNYNKLFHFLNKARLITAPRNGEFFKMNRTEQEFSLTIKGENCKSIELNDVFLLLEKYAEPKRRFEENLDKDIRQMLLLKNLNNNQSKRSNNKI